MLRQPRALLTNGNTIFSQTCQVFHPNDVPNTVFGNAMLLAQHKVHPGGTARRAPGWHSLRIFSMQTQHCCCAAGTWEGGAVQGTL